MFLCLFVVDLVLFIVSDFHGHVMTHLFAPGTGVPMLFSSYIYDSPFLVLE